MQTLKNKSPKKALSVIVVLAFFLGSNVFFYHSDSGNVSAQTIHPCLNRVNIPLDQLHWLYIPENADQLYSDEQYFFLAGQLIKNNVVDASICPTGGLMDNGYANACGMATAADTVIVVQNMVNESVLQAWREVGVPPVLLKQMIRRESQFWPSQYTFTTDETDLFYEYGFGHITYMGMQNALYWNRDLYAKICSTSTHVNCREEDGIVNQFLTSLIATCDGCKYGLDPNLVDYSVDIMAESVLGHCYQTSQLIYNATDWYPSLVVNYSTLWKLTLMDYTSGPNCVYDTIAATFQETEGPMSWDEISANVAGGSCEYGLNYANQITSRYYDFPPD